MKRCHAVWSTPLILLLLHSAVSPAQQAPPVFKSETKLVLVPVTVRDAKGEAVGNLTKDDFRLFDNGKEQSVVSFSAEETTARVAADRSLPSENAAPENAGAAAAGQPKPGEMAIPEHYIALLFDDQHVKNCDPDPPPGYIGCIGDLWYARDAARKILPTLKPGDRVAVLTSTGNVKLDFTSDRAKIEQALMGLREGRPVMKTVANSPLAGREIENQTEEAIRWCNDIVRRMAHLPGQRTVVFISPGLLLHGGGVGSWSSVGSAMNLIDNAIRSRVVFNSLDARGLSPDRAGAFWEFQERITDGTGGKFIRDTNDLNGGMERLAATPKYIYVLGFSPQDIKEDGAFHRLTVKLREGHGMEIQARAGYNAPDAKELARKQSQPAPAASAPRVSEADTQQVAKALGVDFVAPAPQAPPQTGPEAPVTFKAETNLVLVPAVVRDERGNAVGGLSKDDFQLLRDGKAQAIASFAVEDTSGREALDRSVGGGAKPGPMVMPEHFAALMFDDAHFDIHRPEDIAYPRNAALKYLETLQPADRVALFTSSGQYDVDFTTDRSRIKDALLKIAPGPTFFHGMPPQQVARSVISQCDKILTRMSHLPGQRTLVFVSAGMPIEGSEALGAEAGSLRQAIAGERWTAVPETMRLIDRAIRARVVINGLDVRGLGLESPTRRAWEFQLRISDGTGGKFIRDSNDLESAVRQLAATPLYIYVLGFSPDGETTNGAFHKLEVKLRAGRHFEVQARNGYYDAGAPALAEKPEPAPEKAAAPRYSETDSKQVAHALDIAPVAPPAVQPAASTPAGPAKDDEITTTERPANFKVQSNLVEVPVIVRDRAGNAIGNLKQEDFRILDKGKRQEVSKFSLVKSAGAAVENKAAAAAPNVPQQAASTVPAAVPPGRFVAFVFDDLHLRVADIPQVRNAVLKYLGTSIGPKDRVALYTTSGQQGIDFTDHAETVSEALNKISPSPITELASKVSYFQAFEVDRQVGLEPMSSDVSKCLALRVAVADYGGDFRGAVNALRDAYSNGLQESRATLATLRIVVQRMAATPGQRSILLVSPGFFVPADLQSQGEQLATLAIRSKVLINTVDARGIWTNQVFSAEQKGADAATVRDQMQFRDLEAHAHTDELIALAEDTGGRANLNNDFFGGVQNAAAAPEYLYVLGFVPQDLKLDSSFHPLKVTLASGEKLTIQARRGYWAPKHAEDEASVSKQEIEDAVFSRDEIHSLPVEMHTQVTKDGDKSKLSVLTSVDLKSLQLRKANDRNRNDVTIVATVFDTNGNFLMGTEKILQLRLRDETVAKLDQKPPVTIAADFDLKPGAYLVRLVARDAEGQQITAENGAVQVQ